MSTILETHQDPNYEPSQAEVIEYGKWLGMEMPADEHLLWIAREGLKAPLPDHWKACKSEKGELYYFNFKSGQSIWDHPLDDHYKKLFKEEKENPSSKSKGKSEDPAATDAATFVESSHQLKNEEVDKKLQQPHKKRPNSSGGSAAAAGHQGDAVRVPEDAAASKSSQLPPSGKTSTTKTASKHTTNDNRAALPALQGFKPSAASTTTPSAGNSSEDEHSSQDSAGPRSSVGKLRELKTLKTKKDMPGELRIEAVPTAAPAEVVAVSLDVHAKAPLKKTQPAPTTQAADKPSAMQTPSDVDSMNASPATQEIYVGGGGGSRSSSREAKRRIVSFSNEEVAAAHEGKKHHIEAELMAELERYRLEETARVQRLKDECNKSLEASLRKVKEAAQARHNDTLRTIESDHRHDLQQKKAKVSHEVEEQLAQHRRHEEERMSQRLKALRDDIASNIEMGLRSVRDAGVEGGNRFLEAMRHEQAAFAAAVTQAMKAQKEAATAAHDDGVQLLKATLQAEQQLIQTRLRDMQSECNAKVSVLKMENDNTLEAMRSEFEAQKSSIEAEHREELQRLVAELRKAAEQELSDLKDEYTQRRANVVAGHEPKPLPGFKHPSDPLPRQHQQQSVIDSPQHAMLEAISAAERSSDDSGSGRSLVDLAMSLNAATQTSTPAAVRAPPLASTKGAPAPLSEGLLASSASNTLNVPHDDLRVVITDVLRELFKGSPFIVPSPASQNPSAQGSPTSFGRELEQNTQAATNSALNNKQQHHSVVVQGAHQPSVRNAIVADGPTAAPVASSTSVGNVSLAPESFQEQRQLLLDERRRLLEAKAFVDNQRVSLEERRAQLKAARRHWKADVMAAKAQGVAATSKKGLLLQKVHKVLDKQAVGLQHDDNLLKDSEHWLRTKEQRLVRLEGQMEEHERSRQGAHEMSTVSVDTTALVTGFFKPQTTTARSVASLPLPATPHEGGSSAAAKPAVDAPLSSSRSLSGPKPSTRATAAASNLTSAAAADVPKSRSISPMLSKALERIERRLDKVAQLVVAAGPPQPQSRSASAGADGAAAATRRRSSRSNSRTRHVDFAPNSFADPWADMPTATA